MQKLSIHSFTLLPMALALLLHNVLKPESRVGLYACFAQTHTLTPLAQRETHLQEVTVSQNTLPLPLLLQLVGLPSPLALPRAERVESWWRIVQYVAALQNTLHSSSNSTDSRKSCQRRRRHGHRRHSSWSTTASQNCSSYFEGCSWLGSGGRMALFQNRSASDSHSFVARSSNCEQQRSLFAREQRFR